MGCFSERVRFVVVAGEGVGRKNLRALATAAWRHFPSLRLSTLMTMGDDRTMALVVDLRGSQGRNGASGPTARQLVLIVLELADQKFSAVRAYLDEYAFLMNKPIRHSFPVAGSRTTSISCALCSVAILGSWLRASGVLEMGA